MAIINFMQILIVEDSKTLSAILQKLIEEVSHTAIAVKSGEEALQYIEVSPVDMILMDIEMPGLDGLETTKLIRESLDGWIPIIFISGKSGDEYFAKGIEAGGDDYLIKPVSRIILQAKIKAMERILSMQQQLNSLYKELESLHRYDGLTQIYNRVAFKESALKMWNLVARKNGSIAVLMLDIDHFKQYNDHYGHPAGDSCLRKVSHAIRVLLNRSGDLFGRYGGEEFIVALANTDAESAMKTGENIRRAVESLEIPHAKSTTGNIVTISIGGSLIPNSNDNTLEEVIQHADTALYKAKKGRNTTVIEEFLFRSHKNILILNADNDALLTLKNIVKSRAQILSADNSEECLELLNAIKTEIIFINSQISILSELQDYTTLLDKISEENIPLVYFTSNLNSPSDQAETENVISIQDEDSLRSIIYRYFPE